MTFISFNTAEIKVIRFDEAAENCSEINDEVYQPAEMTPLYDADVVQNFFQPDED